MRFGYLGRARALVVGVVVTLGIGGVVRGPSEIAAAQEVAAAPRLGVLVMAHGGDEVWNSAVSAAVGLLEVPHPVELAFGMADRATLQVAVDALAAQGVERVVVLRLFISGESFLDPTRYLLGLSDAAPGHLMDSGRIDKTAPVVPLVHSMDVAISPSGLADAPAIGAILAQRAAALSSDPGSEDVLLLAHGMGADDANDRLLVALERRAAQVRAAAPYRRVVAETLREDWTGKRQQAEQRIRAFVTAGPGTVLVIPFRLSGFGPYAEVLADLDYRADPHGLLPHENVIDWMKQQIQNTACLHAWLPQQTCQIDP